MKTAELKYPEFRYVQFDPFEGDRDVDIKLQKVKLVKARKTHICQMGLSFGVEHHEVEPGQLARYEKALVEGKFRSYYCCIPGLLN